MLMDFGRGMVRQDSRNTSHIVLAKIGDQGCEWKELSLSTFFNHTPPHTEDVPT